MSLKIALLGVIDTGALYRSTVGISMTADGKFIDISLEQVQLLDSVIITAGSHYSMQDNCNIQ